MSHRPSRRIFALFLSLNALAASFSPVALALLEDHTNSHVEIHAHLDDDHADHSTPPRHDHDSEIETLDTLGDIDFLESFFYLPGTRLFRNLKIDPDLPPEGISLHGRDRPPRG